MLYKCMAVFLSMFFFSRDDKLEWRHVLADKSQCLDVFDTNNPSYKKYMYFPKSEDVVVGARSEPVVLKNENDS